MVFRATPRESFFAVTTGNPFRQDDVTCNVDCRLSNIQNYKFPGEAEALISSFPRHSYPTPNKTKAPRRLSFQSSPHKNSQQHTTPILSSPYPSHRPLLFHLHVPAHFLTWQPRRVSPADPVLSSDWTLCPAVGTDAVHTCSSASWR